MCKAFIGEENPGVGRRKEWESGDAGQPPCKYACAREWAERTERKVLGSAEAAVT